MGTSPVRVVAAVVESDGRYLVAKRPMRKSQGGFWEFPGGKIESGEDSRSALEREMVEELDARDIAVSAFLGIADYNYGSTVVRLEAYRVTCDPTSRRCVEHDELGWFRVAELEHLPLAPADRFLIEVLRSSW